MVLLTQLYSLSSEALCLASLKAPVSPVQAAAQVQEAGQGDGSVPSAVLSPALLSEPA